MGTYHETCPRPQLSGRTHYCGVLLQETITGKRREGDHEVCSDCYYERLGQLIEEHPIVGARVHRG